MKTYKRKLVFKAPERWTFWSGVICASLIPVLIGLIVAIQSFRSGALTTENWTLFYPFAATFIFGTPLVAILSARVVLRYTPLSFFSVLKISLIRASLVHLVCGLIQVLIMARMTPAMPQDNVIGMYLGVGAIGHSSLWFTITLPLTLICTLIFRFASLRKERPEDLGHVFQ